MRQVLRYWSACFNTQPPEGGWHKCTQLAMAFFDVSTHSRPKAAGVSDRVIPLTLAGFNTQPPEGGWRICKRYG